MADIRLAKPAAGAQESVQCAPDARFVFDFPATDATLAREGDNLNISFEDGSKLQLQGFYQEYNGENLPSFNIDGTEVAAADFFQAMNEPDLMPAAGPGTGTVANGARFHEWGDSSLASGITHLNGLDWGFSRSFEWDDVPNAVGYHDDDEGGWRAAPDAAPDAGPANHPVTITPENPGSVPPGTVFPGDDASDIASHGDVRLIMEKDLREAETTSVKGSLKVDAPDGLAAIEIDGVPIWQNGQMVDPSATFQPHGENGEGYFHDFAYDPATGILSYTYTLTSATQEHQQSGPDPDHIAHSLPVTVRDVDGDSATSSITIVIRDDVPDLRVTYSDDEEKTGFMYEYDKASGMKAVFTSLEEGSQVALFKEAGFSTAKSDAFYFAQDKDTRSDYSWQAEAKNFGDAGTTENVAHITKYVDPDNPTPNSVAFKMTASAVHYKYKATENGQLEVEKVVDLNNLLLNTDKSLCITEDGLGVGNDIGDRAWNNGLGGISPYKTHVSSTADNADFTRLINAGDWGVTNPTKIDDLNLEKLNNAYDGENYGVIKKDWGVTAIDNKNISEAIIFDLENVSYGINLDLGKMEDFTGKGHDRVLVTFLMTPRNSNDDVIVDKVEIPINELTETKDADGNVVNWHWEHHVEAGFTKVFVSAIRTGENYTTDGFRTTANGDASTGRVDNANGFTIRGVEFLTAVWKTEGDVEAVSADGTGDYQWDWSAFIPANGGDKTPEAGEDPVAGNTSGDSETFAGSETPAGSELPPDSVDAVVHVKGIKGGDYAVTWAKDPEDGSLSCKLGQKDDGQGNLVNGDLTNRNLFTVTLDSTSGQWTVAQYFEFYTLAFLAGTDLEGPFRITVEDLDHDRTTQVLDIDAQFVRFGEQLTGHYDKAWITDATQDQAADILVGSELENSLIYGKGGDDVLIGDKFEDIENADALQQLLASAKTSEDVASSHTHHHDKILDAMAGKDASTLSKEIEAIESNESGDDALFGGTGNDILFGGGGNDELHGNEGDDILFGGSGEDYLYGDAGNDYLHGGTGADHLYGGAGNDLIVYDATDYLIDGGEGIDFLLVGDGVDANLGDLLTGQNDTIVHNVEVLLKGADAMSLTNIPDLEEYGITMGEDGKSLTLSDSWTSDPDEDVKTYGEGADAFTVTTWKNGDLTLETTLTDQNNDHVLQAATNELNTAQG